MIPTNDLPPWLNRFARVQSQMLTNLAFMDGLLLVVDRQEG